MRVSSPGSPLVHFSGRCRGTSGEKRRLFRRVQESLLLPVREKGNVCHKLLIARRIRRQRNQQRHTDVSPRVTRRSGESLPLPILRSTLPKTDSPRSRSSQMRLLRSPHPRPTTHGRRSPAMSQPPRRIGKRYLQRMRPKLLRQVPLRRQRRPTISLPELLQGLQEFTTHSLARCRDYASDYDSLRSLLLGKPREDKHPTRRTIRFHTHRNPSPLGFGCRRALVLQAESRQRQRYATVARHGKWAR